MSWNDSSTPAFPASRKNDRCPTCDIPVGAAHLKTCVYTGSVKARVQDNRRRRGKE
ncbi:hypothetical protein GCM10023322_63130 [Rugosimonospora acidiphila]|uniref:Uncharacterized protein n=1 Tax=Rugosimonospora acidiphila TaxID=556531 RepID=A0ABP9SI32_9ACTN